MALSWVDGKDEIRIVVIGADPGAVEGDLRGDTASEAWYVANILNHVNESLVGIGLANGVLGVVLFDVEFHVHRAAGSLSGGDGGLILGKGG
jgi:hypothetical protein